MAPSTLSARRVRLMRAVLLVCATLALGCDGEVVNLGSSERMLAGGDGGSVNVGGTTPGGAPQLWNLQATPVLADEGLVVANGTLDADMTELFYSKQSRASEAKTQIYRADATGSGFGGENALTLGTW